MLNSNEPKPVEHNCEDCPREITRDEWYEDFKPVEIEGELYELTNKFAIHAANQDNLLWTEMDNGTIQSDYHYVNRVRYIYTDKPHYGIAIVVHPND